MKTKLSILFPVVVAVLMIVSANSVVAGEVYPTPTPTSTPTVSPRVKTNVRVNICHKTSSKRVPYIAIRVNLNAFDGEGKTDHTQHGDFQYWGPVNRFGSPTREGNAWCKAQVTPTPTPTSTPGF